MNRHQRRAQAAEERRIKKLAKTDQFAPARADGRPLYFDIGPNDKVQCLLCLKNGLEIMHGYREAVFNDPANSPEHDGASYFICVHHLPDDAVIYNRPDDTCRDKGGSHVWKEH